MEEVLFGLFSLTVSLVLYFIPAGIAAIRKHNQTMAIFLVNLLLGWTVLGWVIALIWAFVNSLGSQQVIVNNQSPIAQPTIATPSPVPAMRLETMITAKKGALTYRVLAYRQLTEEECKRVVMDALQRGEIEEPPPGGTATIITDIA